MAAVHPPPSPQDKQKQTQRACFQDQLRKTKLCVYHLKGSCKNGRSCSYAHSDVELQSAPDLKKTRLCKAFASGACDNPKCTYAHSAEELRSSEMFFKKTLCIWYARDKCRNGAQCRFAHGSAELHRYRQLAAAEAQRSNNSAEKRSNRSSNSDVLEKDAFSRSFIAENWSEPMKVQTGLSKPSLADESTVAYAIAADAIKTHLSAIQALQGSDLESSISKDWNQHVLERLRQAMTVLTETVPYAPPMEGKLPPMWGSDTTADYAGFEENMTSGSGSSSEAEMRVVDGTQDAYGECWERDLNAGYMPWNLSPALMPPGIGRDSHGYLLASQALRMGM